ncbi:MAG: cyclic nucleotide-binding domain-containing protein, partial [Flavobacteriaceae bacterium]|nr:cyclic nucleotide-binding domain-containing protein [Flavobacteriaceae bacterium]
MKNTIADRVAQFLKDFPPFDLLNKTQLVDIASQVTIKYVEKNQIIFKQNEPTANHFYCIHKGAVSLNEDES